MTHDSLMTITDFVCLHLCCLILVVLMIHEFMFNLCCELISVELINNVSFCSFEITAL